MLKRRPVSIKNIKMFTYFDWFTQSSSEYIEITVTIYIKLCNARKSISVTSVGIILSIISALPVAPSIVHFSELFNLLTKCWEYELLHYILLNYFLLISIDFLINIANKNQIYKLIYFHSIGCADISFLLSLDKAALSGYILHLYHVLYI